MPATFDPMLNAACGLLAASAQGRVLHPVLIIVLCAVAGVATIMLLPGRREASFARIGGVILAAAAIIFAALLLGRRAGMHFYFWVFALIALAGAVRVVTHPRPVYSALYFVLTVFATAGLFVLLWAEFMAAALVLIYAGAILVTYVFVIMLASQPSEGGSGAGARAALADYDAVSREPVVAATLGFTLMGILLFVILDKADPIQPQPMSADVVKATGQGEHAGSTQMLGAYLFQGHLVNLELAGLILTIATVGAIIIARRRILTGEEAGTGAAPEQVVAGSTPVDDNPYSIPVYGTDNPRQKAYPET